MPSKSISFYTFGCRLNQSETSIVQKGFERKGYRIVGIESPSDIAVINTCTVTENGDTQTRRLVNKVCAINPAVQIALIGCQAQIQKGELSTLPNVKWIVGNEKKMELAGLIEELSLTPHAPSTHIITPSIKKKAFAIPFAGHDPHHTRANLKIQDGCDFFCSFCEIPFARGRARSRMFEDILKEARALVAHGHKEIVLTGINIGTYANEGNGIVDVISALENISDLHRIRISSIEPTTIPAALIKKMSQRTKLCRHLHIPLQNANNEILRAMKRKYKIEGFADFVKQVYEQVPEVCIGTDVIVGFPGETDDHFERGLERIRELPLHYIHVFSYSNRKLAKSRLMTSENHSAVITRRSKALRELSERKRRIFQQGLVNSRQSVIFERKRQEFWEGLTDNYVRVYVKADGPLHSTIREVQIDGMQNSRMLGSFT